MQPISNGNQRGWRICVRLLCLSIVFLGAVCCGYSRTIISYNQTFSTSPGQCQGTNLAPVAGESTLALAVLTGPNITLCILRASDGTLLRHFDLTIHGDVVGRGNGLFYINERGGADGGSLALCAVHIPDGVTYWCQTRVLHVISTSSANGIVFATASDENTPDTTLIALKEASGQILWSFHTQNDSRKVLPAAVGQGFVALSTYQSIPTSTPATDTATPEPTTPPIEIRSVCAFQADHGKQLWCHSLPVQSISALVADEHTVYVQNIDYSSTTTTVYALAAEDGSVSWKKSLTYTQPSATIAALTVSQGIVFIAAGDFRYQQGKLIAWRASNGQHLWEQAWTQEINAITASAGLVYVLSNQRQLSILKSADGTPARFVLKLGSEDNANPGTGIIVARQNAIYLLADVPDFAAPYTSVVLALKASNAEPLWADASCAPASTPEASTPVAGLARIGCYWSSAPGGSRPVTVQLLQIDDQS